MKSKLLSVFYYGYLADVSYLLECDTHGHFITPVISIYMTLYIPCRTTGYLHVHVHVHNNVALYYITASNSFYAKKSMGEQGFDTSNITSP